MPATPTRTLNPLPFADLEPHRFEDLVRQLAYDFRRWSRVEATGRSGSDDGQDIRAVESVDEVEAEDEDAEDVGPSPPAEERLWIFQCKREKSLTPKRVLKAIDEAIRESSPYPS